MSAYPNGSPGATYQTVVIALVAAGIVGTGIMSVVWRRRSHRRWMQARARLPPGGDGRVWGGVGGAAGAGAGAGEAGMGMGKGKRPMIWDTVVGAQGEIPEKADAQVPEGADVDFGGLMQSGWKVPIALRTIPTTLALVETASRPIPPALPPPPTSPVSKAKAPPAPPPTKTYHAEMTVLIAMPDASAPGPSDYARRSLSGPPRPQPQLQDGSAWGQDEPDPLYRYTSRSLPRDRGRDRDRGEEHEDQDGPLPPLSIGTTFIPVSNPAAPDPAIPAPGPGTGTGRGNNDLDALISAAEREAAGLSPRARENGFGAWAIPSATPTVDPLALPPSASARYALIRSGALSSFGTRTAGAHGRGMPSGG